ncbi:MAG: hypothetical protein AB9903_04410 [Vulcanimicrobiota bacterium]
METKKFTYYQENCLWVGWLEEYPDYRTQCSTLEELEENLKDIYRDLNSGKISYKSLFPGRPQLIPGHSGN